MKSGEEFLILTPKGAEELRDHKYQLDVTARNILQLIDEGAKTADAILQRSMFPHNAVIDGLRRLLKDRFATMASDDGAALPQSAGKPGSAGRPARKDLRLKFGVSPSQARFALSNFCMDEFGTEGQYLVDAISLCTEVMSLQEVLNSIRAEVDERFPNSLPVLVACVREINDTDEATASSVGPAAAASKPAPREPTSTPSKPVSGKPVPTAVSNKPAPITGVSNKPVAGKPVWDKQELDKPAVAAGAAQDSMRLETGVSVAQTRFALSEFCLNHFGVKGQELVDAVNRCVDVVGLQRALNSIRTEVLNHHRDLLPALAVCVREINETAA